MKASDLMIGDFVQIKGQRLNSEYQVEEVMIPMKIAEICNTPILEHLDSWEDNEKYQIVPNFECISPVPLTVDILEKNGWWNVSDEDAPVMQIEDHCDAFWWDSMNGECGCERSVNKGNEEDIEKTFMCAHICYIHELQHALKLCGIDKEIVL